MANTFKWGPMVIPQGKEPVLGNIGQPVVVNYTTTATASSFTLFNKNFPFKGRLVYACGAMAAAGAASDTIKIQKGDGAASETFADITDAVDVSAKGDTDFFNFGEIDDANYTIPVNGSIKIVSVSAPQVEVTMWIVPVNE